MNKAEREKMSVSELQSLLYEAGKGRDEILEELRYDKRKGVKTLVERYEKMLFREKEESNRLAVLWEKERLLQKKGFLQVAGIDEAGRGPLAGPVVAACVLLPCGVELTGLNDSKKLSPGMREKLAGQIKDCAVAWGVGLVDNEEIDRINILNATEKAMLLAVEDMNVKPDYLLIDAMNIQTDIRQEGIIHGDAVCASIAAASIIAKTHRDFLMEEMDTIYPQYDFRKHKGYGTLLHMKALTEHGPCPVHRMSFIQKFIG